MVYYIVHLVALDTADEYTSVSRLTTFEAPTYFDTVVLCRWVTPKLVMRRRSLDFTESYYVAVILKP